MYAQGRFIMKPEQIGESTWAKELRSFTEQIGVFFSVNKLNINGVAEDDKEVLVKNKLMNESDYAYVISDYLEKPPAQEKMLELDEYLDSIVKQSIDTELIRTANDYGILIIRKVIH